MKDKNLKPIGKVLGDSWNLYKKHMNELALVALVPFLFLGVKLALWPYLYVFIGVPRSPAAAVVGGCFSLLYLVFIVILPYAMVTATGEAQHGKRINVNTVYEKAFSSIWPYLFIVLITGIIVFGGSVLFIVPGIVASIYLSFALFTFLFEKKTGIDALVLSAWYVRHFWWDILARKIVLALIVIVAMFAFSILAGLLCIGFNFGPIVFKFLVDLFAFMFIIPFVFAFYYETYKDLKSAKHAREESTEPSKAFIHESEKLLVILIIVAAIAALFLFCLMNMIDVTGYRGTGMIMISAGHMYGGHGGYMMGR